MKKNTKQTSPKMATMASNVLHDPDKSYTQKRLAESALAQANTDKQTGEEMKDLAEHVLESKKYSKDTKKLAKCVYDQAPEEY